MFTVHQHNVQMLFGKVNGLENGRFPIEITDDIHVNSISTSVHSVLGSWKCISKLRTLKKNIKLGYMPSTLSVFARGLLYELET